MSKITTVLFDMYETLAVNNTGLWVETFAGICQKQELAIPGDELYREWKALEMGFRQDRLNLAEPEKSPPFKSYEEAWRDCFISVFSKLGLRGDADAASRDTVRDMGLRDPYTDALEALPLIQSRWKTGLLSNADDGYLLPVLERTGWEFEAVLSSEGALAYKPHPGPFHQILGMMGVAAGDALYVGDTLYDDVLGAQSVGMQAAWINRHGATLDPKMPSPDFEVSSLTQLPELLQKVR